MSKTRINKSNNLAKYKLYFCTYYNDDTKDVIEESLKILDEENIYMSGFMKFILENPDFVRKCAKKVPKLRKYRKNIQ